MKLNIFKNKILYLLFSFILFLLVSLFIFNDLYHFYINPVIERGSLNNFVKFADWTVIVDANVCYNKGIDVYSANPCDVKNRNLIYGKIALILPFVENNYFFYTKILPASIIFLFLTTVTLILSPKSTKDYFVILLLTFSTPIMLAIERFNTEILIFLIFVLIAYLKKNLVIQFLIFIVSSLKFYPAVSIIIFTSKNMKLKNYIHLSISILIFFLIVLFNLEELKKINTYRIGIPSTVETVGMYIYSFFGLPSLLRVTSDHLGILNSEHLYYIGMIISLSMMIFFSFFFSNFCKKKNISLDLNSEKFEDRLFLLSATILLALYFIKYNFLYVEIFFIGLLPYIKDKTKEMKHFRFLYFLIIFKFIFLTVLWIIQATIIPKSHLFKGFNILIKNFIDIFLISILLSFLISYLFRIIINLRYNLR